MTFSDKLLLAIFSGIIIWILKDLTIYILQRNRIRAALVAEISFLIGAIKDTKQYLDDSFQKTIQAGKEVQYSATYTSEDRDVYKDYAPVLTSYFGERDLARVIKFYRAVQGFEVLSTGFFSDLTEWKKQKRTLSQDDVQYLGRKKARIISIANIITARDVHKISDLPEDYRGELDAGSIVR
jgi:hypothetical protein